MSEFEIITFFPNTELYKSRTTITATMTDGQNHYQSISLRHGTGTVEYKVVGIRIAKIAVFCTFA